MYGIVLLGKFPSFGAIRPYAVTLTATSANGMTTGAAVQLNGVYAGQVTNVSLTNDGGKLVAVIGLHIDHDILTPEVHEGDAQQATGSGQSVCGVDGHRRQRADVAAGWDGQAEAVAADASLIPPQIFYDVHNASKELSKVAADLAHAAWSILPAGGDHAQQRDPNDPNRPRENVSTVVVRLNRLVENLQKLLSDPELQGNVRDAIRNIAEASAQLKTTLQKVTCPSYPTPAACSTAVGVAASGCQRRGQSHDGRRRRRRP